MGRVGTRRRTQFQKGTFFPLLDPGCHCVERVRGRPARGAWAATRRAAMATAMDDAQFCADLWNFLQLDELRRRFRGLWGASAGHGKPRLPPLVGATFDGAGTAALLSSARAEAVVDAPLRLLSSDLPVSRFVYECARCSSAAPAARPNDARVMALACCILAGLGCGAVEVGARLHPAVPAAAADLRAGVCGRAGRRALGVLRSLFLRPRVHVWRKIEVAPNRYACGGNCGNAVACRAVTAGMHSAYALVHVVHG